MGDSDVLEAYLCLCDKSCHLCQRTSLVRDIYEQFMVHSYDTAAVVRDGIPVISGGCKKSIYPSRIALFNMINHFVYKLNIFLKPVYDIVRICQKNVLPYHWIGGCDSGYIFEASGCQ